MPNYRVIASDLEFPEGPVVMPDGSVILVEIMGQRLTRIYPDGRKETVAQVPGGPNGAALGPDGKMYVTNNGGFGWTNVRGTWMPGAPKPGDYLGGKIQRVDIQSGKVETVYDRCGEHTLKGPNDIVFDRQGGFWFTDLGKRYARTSDVGAIHYCKPNDGGIVEAVFSMERPNGIGLSPDETTVYAVETPTCRAWAFTLSAPGEIKPPENSPRNNKGTVIAGLGGYQMFDSLGMEASGNLCVATLVTGAISVIAPDGKLVEQVETGDHMTTNIAFGGPELKTAYITLSGKGELVAMDWPRPGLPLNFLNK
ncbi:glconolactonase [Afipia sp. P52-10]|uniref:SMP-30/gluconolactonase/LRE family protein n=1 Tax=Afipia sp. P52-10 TaxID=1429916 RepID=UPI0003DF29DB|nr:SMP-30/gluconolactonase/LRE family protein [Afipia sp. P52-10]ETR78801.1 glconolactonase [Afipia sp. P52-10]